MDDLDDIRDIVSSSMNAKKALRSQVKANIRSHLVSIIKHAAKATAEAGGDSAIIVVELGFGKKGYAKGDETSWPLYECAMITEWSEPLKLKLGTDSRPHSVELCWEDFTSEMRRILVDLGWTFKLRKALLKSSRSEPYLRTWKVPSWVLEGRFDEKSAWVHGQSLELVAPLRDDDNCVILTPCISVPEDFKDPTGAFELRYYDAQGSLRFEPETMEELDIRYSKGGYGRDSDGDRFVHVVPTNTITTAIVESGRNDEDGPWRLSDLQGNTWEDGEYACMVALVQFQ